MTLFCLLSLLLILKIAYISPLVVVPDLFCWQRLRVRDMLATPYRHDALSLTSLSHGKMAALVITVAATCFRIHSHKRVIAILPSQKYYSYYRKVGVSVDTIYNFLYILDSFRIAPTEYNIHKRYSYSTKPQLHRAQQSPSLRAHFQPPQLSCPTFYYFRPP